MSSAVYTRLAASASRLIADKGQSIPLSRRGADAVFDPVAGETTTAGTDVTATLSAVVLPLTDMEDDRYQEDFARGRMRLLLIAALGLAVEPQAGDEVTFDSKKWELVSSTPINPGGTALVYNAKVREK